MYNYNNFMNDFRQSNDLNTDIFDFSEIISPNLTSSFNPSELNSMTNNMTNNMMNNTNMMQNINLYTPEECYEKGNLFRNLYSQYKNYQPQQLKATDEKSKLWLEMGRNAFAAHELNLYLDINPNDNSIITLFNDYRSKANELKKQYENAYGPICITSDVLNNSPFLWEELKWPWEGGNI